MLEGGCKSSLVDCSVQGRNLTVRLRWWGRSSRCKKSWTSMLCGEGTFSKFCFQIRHKHRRNLALKAYKPGGKYESGFQK